MQFENSINFNTENTISFLSERMVSFNWIHKLTTSSSDHSRIFSRTKQKKIHVSFQQRNNPSLLKYSPSEVVFPLFLFPNSWGERIFPCLIRNGSIPGYINARARRIECNSRKMTNLFRTRLFSVHARFCAFFWPKDRSVLFTGGFIWSMNFFRIIEFSRISFVCVYVL